MKLGYQYKKQILATVAFGFFMVTGTYNAIVINSESHVSNTDMKFMKRLDEVYGIVKPGRQFASNMKWQKIKPSLVQQVQEIQVPQSSIARVEGSAVSEPAAPQEVKAEAAIQEELNLKLTNVMNPKKWKQGLNESQFSGSLTTNNGVVEELNVSVPGGNISVSFSELTGNVFTIEIDGEPYSGMLYQADQNTYKVSLVGGPLDSTILTFSGEPTVEELAQKEQTDMQNEQNKEEVAQAAEAPAETPAPENNPNVEPEYGEFAQQGVLEGDQYPAEAQRAYTQDQQATQEALAQAQGSQELPQAEEAQQQPL